MKDGIRAECVDDSQTLLLPVAIDAIAAKQPTAIWAEYPASATNLAEGYRQVTYADLANAVFNATSFILEVFGKGSAFETLTYCGPNDLRYPIFIVAALKAGYKTLLPSPRNSVDAHRNLFKLSACKKLISPQPVAPSLQKATENLEVQLESPPSLDSLLGPRQKVDEHHDFPEIGIEDPLVVLQTSGTTGLPKPIAIPQKFAIVWSRMTAFTSPRGPNQVNYLHGRRLYCTLPMFHAVGVYFGLISPTYRSTICILPSKQGIPTAEGLENALEVNNFESAFVPPSLVEELAKNPQLLDKVSEKMDTLIYTGGDLPKWAGDTVAAKIRLFTIYGTTEVGHGPQVSVEAKGTEDWGYICWDEEKWGARFREHDKDLFELYYERNDLSVQYQAGFTIFTQVDQFATKDLFSKHPSIPGLWRYRGRSDDTVVFVTGEQVNPQSFENGLSKHPEVNAVLMVGEKRFQSALLIEVKETSELSERPRIFDEIWSAVEKANEALPAYARVLKTHILFTSPEKPFIRAGKGTVIRRLSLELYTDEIDQLYKKSDIEAILASDSLATTDSRPKDVSSAYESAKAYIMKVTKWDSLEDSEDFFARGMDSLQVLQLLSKFRTLGNTDVGVIYRNPTLKLLSRALSQESDYLLNESPVSPTRKLPTRGSSLDRSLLLYRDKLHQMLSSRSNLAHQVRSREGIRVVLTGSTGTVGVYLLKTLLEQGQIEHVYCLCRVKEGRERQLAAMERQQLSYELPEGRVSFIKADLAMLNLGLSESKYNDLKSRAGIIIHNAWKVDFMQSLQSFNDYIDGLINLLTLASEALSECRFLFASSVSAVQRYSLEPLVPEKIMTDQSVCSKDGYGQSKWLAEQLIDFVATEYGMQASIARLGQITGSSSLNGIWNSKEWVPSMIITSVNMGFLPLSLPFSDHKNSEAIVSWIPVDNAAETLVSHALHMDEDKTHSGAEVIHVSNMNRTAWSDILPSALQELNAARETSNGTTEKKTLKTLPYSSWLSTLRQLMANRAEGQNLEEMVETYPALKLLRFFENGASALQLAELDVLNTSKKIPVLQMARAINGKFLAEWARKWVAQ